jgi:Glycosyl transferases group 1
MFTTRSFTRKGFQCVLYEKQDVLSIIDDVDLICLNTGMGYQFRENILRRLVWHDFTNRLVLLNPGLQPIRLSKEYELFIAICATWKDLLHINAIKDWKKKCEKSVCWIDEIWAADLPVSKSWIPALKKFDHVVVGLKGSVDVLSDAIGRQCHYVPSGIDAIRFSPYPHPPPRVIDVYSLGRRWEGIHQALRNMAIREKIFYVYDTIEGSIAQTMDHRQHRDAIADFAMRSQYFMVAPAKMNQPEEVQGQIEIGTRYYEGSAAGAVMLGQVPDCETFHTLFDWPDAVIEIKPDGSDVVDVLSALSGQPERLREISRRNAIEALLRHDWVYRWRQILGISGLTPCPSMEERERHLKLLAENARNNRMEIFT